MKINFYHSELFILDFNLKMKVLSELETLRNVHSYFQLNKVLSRVSEHSCCKYNRNVHISVDVTYFIPCPLRYVM